MNINDVEYPEQSKVLQSIVIDQVTALRILEELAALNRTVSNIAARLDRLETRTNENH